MDNGGIAFWELQDSASSHHKKAGIFWLQFCAVGGSGDAVAIFVCISGFMQRGTINWHEPFPASCVGTAFVGMLILDNPHLVLVFLPLSQVKPTVCF